MAKARKAAKKRAAEYKASSSVPSMQRLTDLSKRVPQAMARQARKKTTERCANALISAID